MYHSVPEAWAGNLPAYCLMRQGDGRRRDSLALGAAYARRRDWMLRRDAALAADDDTAAQDAARFVAEYDDFIQELEGQESTDPPVHG